MDHHLFENWFYEENLTITYYMLADKYRYTNRELHHKHGIQYLAHLQKMEQLFDALQQHIPFYKQYIASKFENPVDYQRVMSSTYMLLADKYKFSNPQLHIYFYQKFLRHVQLLEESFLKIQQNELFKNEGPWTMWQYHGRLAATFLKLAKKYEYINVNTHAYYEKLYLYHLELMEKSFLKMAG